MLPIVVCPIIRIGFPQRWKATWRLTAAFVAVCGLLLLVAMSAQDQNGYWLAERCLGLALGLFAGYVAGERARLAGPIARFGRFCTVNARAVVSASAVLAIAFVSWQLLCNVIAARVFGMSTGLPAYLPLGISPGARIMALLQILDAFIGAWAVGRFAVNLGVPRGASIFAGACWFVTSGRLAPQTMGFQPTCLVPLAAVYWRDVARRGAILCGALGVVVSLAAPQLVVPSCIAVLADYARLRNTAQRVALATGVAAALLVLAIVKIALFPPYAHVIGEAADGIVRYNGGDGSYPWEWLFPGATPLSADATISWQVATVHLGNIWERCASVVPAALLLAIAASLDVLRNDRDLRRFFVVGAAVSVWAALPSHVFGTPVPDPTLILWGLHASASTGAFAALGALFTIVVISGVELAAILRRSNIAYSAVAYAAALLLVIFAPMWNGLSWRPADTPLASQLRNAASRCSGPIAMIPGSSAATPVGQYNRLVADAALGNGPVAQRLSDASLDDLARMDVRARCAIVAFHELKQYVVGPLANASILSPSLMPEPNMPQDFQTLDIPRWDIESIAGDDSVFYRRR